MGKEQATRSDARQRAAIRHPVYALASVDRSFPAMHYIRNNGAMRSRRFTPPDDDTPQPPRPSPRDLRTWRQGARSQCPTETDLTETSTLELHSPSYAKNLPPLDLPRDPMTFMSISAPTSGVCTPGLLSFLSASLGALEGSTKGFDRSVPSRVPGWRATAMAELSLPLLDPPAPEARWSSRFNVLTIWFVADLDAR